LEIRSILIYSGKLERLSEVFRRPEHQRSKQGIMAELWGKFSLAVYFCRGFSTGLAEHLFDLGETSGAASSSLVTVAGCSRMGMFPLRPFRDFNPPKTS
jgi:hypothetical protein